MVHTKAVTEKSTRASRSQGVRAIDCEPGRAESRGSSLLSRRVNVDQFIVISCWFLDDDQRVRFKHVEQPNPKLITNNQ